MDPHETSLKANECRWRWLPAMLGLLVGAAFAAFSLGYSNDALAAVHKLSFRCNFSPQELSEWEFPHPEDWVSEVEYGHYFLHMVRPRGPGVPHRPLQFARLRNVNVGSFSLSVRVRRASRSMVIVFNCADTLHFCYAHVSRDTGKIQPVHNGIFLIDGGPRRRHPRRRHS